MIKQRRPLYIILAIVLLAFNILGCYFSVKYVHIFLDNRINLAAEDLKNNINTRLNAYSDELYGAAGLFAANPNITPQQWKSFVDNTKIISRYPGIEVLDYVPIISMNEEEALQNKAASLGINNYQVHPSKSSQIEAPVLYAEPHVDNYDKLLGFNLLSEFRRQLAINYSIDNNSIAVSDLIVPVVDAGQPNKPGGVIMVLPIYRQGADISTVEQRRANITGLITAGIRTNDLLAGIALKIVPGIKFQVFDDSTHGDLTPNIMLYNSGDMSLLEPGYGGLFLKLTEVKLPNTVWHLRTLVVPQTTFAQLVQFAPYINLFFSLIISALLVLLVRKILNSYSNLKVESLEAKAQLATEDAVVDAYADGIIATDPHGLIMVFNKKAEQTLGYLEAETIGQRNLLSIIDAESLNRQAKKVTEEMNSPMARSFDSLITKSLLEGYDLLELQLLTKNGQKLNFSISVKPLYDPKNYLLGYQFTFK